MTKYLFFLGAFLGLTVSSVAQQSISESVLSGADKDHSETTRSVLSCDDEGLDAVIVEKYYISDTNDATDTDGGSLPAGSVTYRIYLDMAAGYSLETLFGTTEHLLVFETSTEFFNNEIFGQSVGSSLNGATLGFNTTALDSYLTFSGATSNHIGVLKSLDSNGSIVGGSNNDGGSEALIGGLLVNEDPEAGILLTVADGLIEEVPSPTVVVGDLSTLMPAFFGNANTPGALISTDGAFAVLGGLEGSSAENQILIAQITTDGVFSFELNFRLGAPDGGYEQYVHSNPGVIPGSGGQLELTCDDLSYENDPTSGVGLDELNLTNSLQLYPNPSNGESVDLILHSESLSDNDFRVKVLDLSGRVIVQQDGLVLTTGYAKTLPFNSTLSSGMYLLTLEQDQLILSKEFVVR